MVTETDHIHLQNPHQLGVFHSESIKVHKAGGERNDMTITLITTWSSTGSNNGRTRAGPSAAAP